MRIFLLAVLLSTCGLAHAQTYLPGSLIDYNFRGANFSNRNLKDSAAINKKWFVSKYTGISTSIVGWKGGYTSILSVPVGIQLNRKISDNLTAFAGAFVAPAYVNFGQRFMNADFNKSNQNNFFYRSNNLNLYSRAEIGLSYTNDEKTFSISGSIGVERSSGNFPVRYYNSKQAHNISSPAIN